MTLNDLLEALVVGKWSLLQFLCQLICKSLLPVLPHPDFFFL